MKSKKIITICSSAAFYKQILEIEEELKKLGFKVKIPHTANTMKKRNDFNVENYKTWHKNSNNYHLKTKLMVKHFKKVIESNAIIVVNLKKNGVKGYIGGNVLMEMAIAFHYKKPIFIYDNISEKLTTQEEIYGMSPIFINRDLKQITKLQKLT